MFIILLFISVGFELKQARVEKWSYFSKINNINDMIFIVSFFAYAGCDHWLGTTKEDNDNYEVTRIMLCFLLMTGFLKLMSLNRINDNISFITRMLVKVVVAIIPFLFLFTALIVVFSFIVYALGFSFESMDDENPYKSIGLFGYLFYLFRTSTGDFDVE